MMNTLLEELNKSILAKRDDIQDAEHDRALQDQNLRDLQHFGQLLEKLSHQRNKISLELTFQMLQVKLKTKTLKQLQTLEDRTRQEFRHFLDQWVEQWAQDLDSDSDSDTEEPKE